MAGLALIEVECPCVDLRVCALIRLAYMYRWHIGDTKAELV